MTEAEDTGVASIDLSVAFFCCVLTLFVFVAFRLSDVEEDPQASIGQRLVTQTVLPPTWHPVNERGGFAMYRGTSLSVLDMGGLAAGIIDPLDSYFGDRGGLTWSGAGVAPNAFRLNVRIRPADIPETWRRGPPRDLSGAPSCENLPFELLTVFVPDSEADLAPLIAFAHACGLRLRFEFIAEPGEETGLTGFAIGLGPGAFSRERILR